MSERKPQFDKFLGGSIKLPYEVDYLSFAKSRTQEILALSEAIGDPQRVGLAFQQLPRHMRRRVMGHNSRRLPRSIREIHQRQLEKSGLPPPSKRPTRRHRRRPHDLLSEYNRRQKEFTWLETHIWHAKRFHMINKWGYKIANFPNDKSFRACYRASSKHCLLQDLSYLSCIELTGPLNKLLDGFKQHTSQECGPTFGARCFLNGTREGNVAMFRCGMFPSGAIGNVSFLWKPLENELKPDGEISQSTDIRTLWIWIHPSFYDEVLEELIGTFKLEKDVTADINISEVVLEKKDPSPGASHSKKKQKLEKNVEETKLALRNVPFEKTPKYQSSNGIEMILLKDTLNRFRLTGPLSQAILSEALRICQSSHTKSSSGVKSKKSKKINVEDAAIPKIPAGDIDEIFALMSKPVEKPMVIDEESSSDEEVVYYNRKTIVEEENPGDWWTDFYSSNSFHEASLDIQRELWHSLSAVLTPAQLPPHIVLGLTIRDPRLYMPAKRKKAIPDDTKPWQEEFPATAFEPGLSSSASAIWSPKVRDVTTRTKLSVAKLNRERAKNYLVPGFVDDAETCREGVPVAEDRSRIPVLLIQRPGSQQAEVKRLGYASGWDIVLPAGWGMPLWMSLVFRGARVGGLREAVAVGREASDVSVLPPDTMAGRREADQRKEELTDKHFRLPPDKRPNYIKLGISSPFYCPWNLLLREWNLSGQLRDPSVQHPGPRACSLTTPAFVLRHRQTLAALKAGLKGKKCDEQTMVEIKELIKNLRNCIVPVAIKMAHKGTPTDFSLICVPSVDDLDKFTEDSNYPGPVEPSHEDVNYELRQATREEHKALLKRLRKRRVRKSRKEKEQETETGESSKARRKPNEPVDKEVVEEYAVKDRQLWLPQTVSAKDNCSRSTMGYVAQGDYSFTESCGAGVGYVALSALVSIIAARVDGDGKPAYALVRNPTSYQYRLAQLDVLCC